MDNTCLGDMVLRMFRRIKDRKLYSNTDSVPAKPPVLEKLEPRILLCGDGLLNIAPPDPLLDNTQQVVQHVELLETEKQLPTAGQEIHQELDSSDQLGTDLCEPIFTLCAEGNDNTFDDAIDTNLTAVDEFDEATCGLSAGNVGSAQTGDDIAALSNDPSGNIISKILATEIVAAERPTTNSPAIPSKDGSMPTYVSDADSSVEFATSIEIRGPPVGTTDQLTTFDSNDYTTPEVFAETSYVDGVLQLKAPDLPGLQLVDPDICSWQGQIVHLDFDGAEDVTYNGPVTVEGIDVPALAGSGNLSGQEESIITGVVEELNQIFAGSGAIFTLRLQTAAMLLA